MSDDKPDLTPTDLYEFEATARAYAYGREDAGQKPRVSPQRFMDAAVAARLLPVELGALYDRMLASGDGVLGGES